MCLIYFTVQAAWMAYPIQETVGELDKRKKQNRIKLKRVRPGMGMTTLSLLALSSVQSSPVRPSLTLLPTSSLI